MCKEKKKINEEYRYFLCHNSSFNEPAEHSSFTIFIMAHSIRLFQFIQEFSKTIGIDSSQTDSIKSKNAIFTVCPIQYTLTTVAFLIIEANSMFDYGFGFYSIICMINGIVIYLLFNWQYENTLKFIGTCEEFIAKSKCID